MTFKELALTRISPKFVNGNNYRNVLRFMVNIYDKTSQDLVIIKDLKNLESQFSLVLDEIGKLLGVYPRPFLEIGLQGIGFFQYGITEYGTAPYASQDENIAIRSLTNEEYIRLLKAAATLTAFNGTMNDWLKFFTELSGGVAVIVNKPSSYDIIIKKDLTLFEKNLVEFLSDRVDNLTVKKDFLGTTDGVQPFQYGVAGYDTSPYVNSW
jgi:hypothetical protein